ncbi:hypothetical protein MGYG_07678 [Nannizzia gypsea CBS 118893]|uniref:Uncharacterized protein n=1 Tax=Arthroderma gypseum (strain ATCC MYA-4604 / CBS 118893) TaxID=535722 RepID=E4V3U8_ARTGP|nr:hypothetical protein MGYG_07678 [Nannizzia gypsea CBS 118893]EFR04672.1 hypothetical protein MGYG_07678 [Nannizzia gypsea CBS 118893]
MSSGPSRQTINARQPRKRYHEEISGPHSDGESQTSRSRRGESSSSVDTPGALSSSINSSRPRLPPLPPFPRVRYPGDGFDFRRPVMSTGVPARPHSLQLPPQEDVIDLTQDSDPVIRPALTPGDQEEPVLLNRASRGPRFGRNIMVDVVDLEADSPPGHQQQQQQQQPSSPEVEFLGSSLRPRASRAPDRSHSDSRHPLLWSRSSDMPHVQRGTQRPGRLSPLDREEMLRRELSLRTRGMLAFQPVTPMAASMHWLGSEIDLTSDLNPFAIQLDYSTTAFAGGEAPRTEPVYEPPPPPPDGFTRTVTEEEEAICPNCERELGTGDELGKQIWVSRACGHVYCGTCTKNRAVSSRAKKSDHSLDIKSKPFAKCVVANCGRSVSQPRTMFQIYL